MGDEVEIDTFLAGLGFTEGPLRDRAMQVLIDARLTNGRKRRMSGAKVERARAALSSALLRACDDSLCQLRARVASGDRTICTVDAIHCDMCAGDPARRVVRPHRPNPDELVDVVYRLVSSAPSGMWGRTMRDDLRRLGLEITRGDLRDALNARNDLFLCVEDRIALRHADDNAVDEEMDEPAPDISPGEEPTPRPDESFEAPGVNNAPVIEGQRVAATEDATPLSLATPEPHNTDDSGGLAAMVPVAVATFESNDNPAPFADRGESERYQALEDERWGSFHRAILSIEDALRRRIGEEMNGRSGYALVDAVAEQDPLINTQKGEIIQVLRLRNSFMHRSINGLPLATPNQILIDYTWRLARSIAQSRRALDYLEDPLAVNADASIEATARNMRERGVRFAVVFRDEEFIGLLTLETALGWALDALSGDGQRHGTVGDIVSHDQPVRVQHLPASTRVSDLVALMHKTGWREGPAVYLFSAHGDGRAPIRGIATLADLPRLEVIAGGE